MSILPGENKKKVFFFKLLPFANSGIEKTCNKDIWKTIIARSFKLGQLLEDND